MSDAHFSEPRNGHGLPHAKDPGTIVYLLIRCARREPDGEGTRGNEPCAKTW